MMKYFFAAVFLFTSFLAHSQVVIQGLVKDAQTDKGLAGVNVSIREKGKPAILGFKLTDNNGRYRLEYRGDNDTLIVSVSGFNVRKQEKTVPSKSQTLDFLVSSEAITLKEVKITAPKIKQTGDTIAYSVVDFTDKNDRTIGDVLKKLPGVDVTESGQVLYQNKPINKFYIEGSDLLQGRYGIATNNIEAKEVSKIEVLENHQPIKVLKDKIFSENAAINLKLKETAKGKVISNAMLGAGLPPTLLSGELMGMYFNKNRQNITTYKGNNTGDDVSRDMNAFYSRDADRMSDEGMLSVQSPSSPSINRKRYLFNQVNNVTFNNLWKLNKDYQLNANIHYINDRLDKSSLARTEYYLPGDSVIQIREILSSRLYMNRLDGEVQLTANTDKFYLNNLLKLNAGWDRERGDAITADSIHQHLDKPNYAISNSFEIIKDRGKTLWNISSFNGFSVTPHTLTVQPVIYPELFGTDATGLKQKQDMNHFTSDTKAAFGINTGFWKQNYEIGFRADLQHLESELTTIASSIPNRSFSDSLRNDLQWNKYRWYFRPSYTYMRGDWRINLGVPVSYTFLHINDRIMNGKENTQRIYVNPFIFIHYTFSAYWDAYVSANLSNGMGGLGNEYTGYIMRSYRNLVRNTGSLYETQSANTNLNLNYRNPIKSLFGNVGINYFNNKANLLYGYDLNGILQVQTSLAKPNNTQGITTYASVNQTIDAIASTVKLGGNYSVSSGSQLAQGEILKYSGKSYSLTPSLNTKIRSWSSFNYSFTFSESRNTVKTENANLKPIRTISQQLQFNIFPVKRLIINLGYEYFYNNTIVSGSRVMSFGDIGCKYKYAGMEFQLTYSNIFNARQYISASYNNINSYYSAYDLRPAEVLLQVRMKLK
ncbi:MAG: carboxypeptidase-like regulatory domain-containing protein [Dysgonamonadaceae bacterium]|nr:carboxypeptidase-like regulatory domain-containing protein [Dysgonamonadaceae bacterium]